LKAVLFALAMGVAFVLISAGGAVGEIRHKLELVGSNGLEIGSQTSDLDMDPSRNVAYVGSFVDLGVAVVQMTDRANPQVVKILDTHYARANDRNNASDSADVDLQGNLLAVASQPWSIYVGGIGGKGFGGVSLYDTSTPFNPVFLGKVWTGGSHDVQIDPAYPNRPYVYSANFESDDPVHGHKVSIINASDPRHPEIMADYRSPEALGCVPTPGHSCDSAFSVFNSAHDLTLLVHPDTGRVLLYVAYWDSGLRIVDVTDPRHPAEIGALDYTPTFTKQGLEATCCAHYAQPTPSGHWVLLEDEIGIGLAGGVHILKADGCDGVHSCSLAQVSIWSPQGAGTQASAIHATLNTNGSLFPNGIIQRFFTRDVHNLDVREDQFLAPAYSSGVFLVDIHDKANPFAVAFWQGAADVKTACHGQNTLIPWGYQGDCFFQGREVWGAKFGETVPGSPSDFYIYASDFWDGFLILRTVTI